LILHNCDAEEYDVKLENDILPITEWVQNQFTKVACSSIKQTANMMIQTWAIFLENLIPRLLQPALFQLQIKHDFPRIRP
jgi:hypothetical protein